jgi:hypothetical protein
MCHVDSNPRPDYHCHRAWPYINELLITRPLYCPGKEGLEVIIKRMHINKILYDYLITFKFNNFLNSSFFYLSSVTTQVVFGAFSIKILQELFIEEEFICKIYFKKNIIYYIYFYFCLFLF